MIIGVIADTHLYQRAAALPPFVEEVFRDAAHILHAGDIVGADVIARLAKWAPVTAVAGNLDPPEAHKKYGDKKIVTLGGYRFGLCHGEGKGGKAADRALGRFQGERVDCIVFGHSHIPYCAYSGDILLFNPGSPTDKRRSRHYSVGLIETGAVLHARHVYFD
jgi:putative phosphoesterase